MSRPESLGVWLYGTLVAEIKEGRNNRLSLQFTEEALDRFGPDSPILSTSLLIREEHYPNAATRNFFDGLLPEGEARNSIVRRINEGRSETTKLVETDTFGLLAEIGRESAGALIIQQGFDPPLDRPISEGQPITNDGVTEKLSDLPNSPLGIDLPGNIRLSLPGVQRKLLLIRRADGGWVLPTGGLPSTHILKPEIADGRFPNSVENESFCMKLAARAGLNVAAVQVEQFNDNSVLVVERFDRTLVDRQLHRIHQEDACQALGLKSKYEQDGGPSLRRLAALLVEFGREDQLTDLLALATFNIVIGNADAHGKNYSLLHLESGEIELAPAYDLMSTALYPDLDRVLGMYVDNVRRVDKVEKPRIVNEGESWGLSHSEAERTVSDVLLGVANALNDPSTLEPYEASLKRLVEARLTSLH